MKEFALIGQLFIALALFVFGIQHFAYLNFVTRAFPPLPLWIPASGVFACIFGALLCLTSLAIVSRYKTRVFTLLLASAIFIMFAIFLLPSLLVNLKNGFLWTNSGKALVLVGANLLVAGSVAGETSNSLLKFLERFIPLGKYLLAGFFILAAILHFIYAEFVATLIPAWIPAHLFWTYFAAIALIAGAIGMLVPKTAKLAAALSALMVFLWVILLHIPRAWTIHDANETTSLFEALAMCGMALLIMVKAAESRNTPQ
ncbi:hypothetical protein GCM10011613_18800 [Cellvibrio zantedeschiae]|uniref:DoxX family protein n=1 Tax=Cellvibrio zantedeschiae TaxID=1237077 RepID=A0ABQ3B3P6_9GAMM|nr:hypothetical protein [Cellvibrio zantedeschiae]GGY73777.1 hypothetical protein GCM10011613_18800 [Cellvibrio zantedeschiae]